MVIRILLEFTFTSWLEDFKTIEGLFNQMAGEVKAFKDAQLSWAKLGDHGLDVKL